MDALQLVFNRDRLDPSQGQSFSDGAMGSSVQTVDQVREPEIATMRKTG